ncbi:Ammonia transport outward protein 2 [Cyphellophora attinorum]|uniref:Ammonia transport outward protein 2 n=1 Tax=Cyphellophora attinorum TaxID=1664694 RepID=A0A0N1HDA6_9EURO|nr:Ammonia transport outward protein 2 [Phialophora attinorum]KPI42275.1 Ammonia transport outward protein 2 [Phialophora attinorum]
MSNGYDATDHAEKAVTDNLERQRTAGGHVDDRSQPSLPVVHRTFANPAPLGLLSFATGIFLISIFGVHARDLTTPNVLIGVLMFFGGVCQFIAGIMEFVAGNTFGATVFPAYAAFNFSYAMIYIPGTGILDAYIDKDTGLPNSQFGNALAMYCWAWFILTVIFTIAAMRSSWILFLDLAVLSIELLLLAVGYMTNTDGVLTAANSLGFVVALLSYWAGCAGLWSSGLTPINVPTFAMYHEKS